MSAMERLQSGQAFGRYQIVRLIGEGGMGVVYEAVHPALKKRFAIKTLLPAVVEREDARIRFLREGEAAASINHPNVVAVSDVGTEDGIPYLVMELLEGQTLGDLLGERRSLPAEEAIALLLPVVSAVATGHDRGVIHRDLKPQNIFLANGPWGERIPKVLDFGVSKLIGGDESAAITRTLTVLGTAAYMSPEQARGASRVDFQSDQYSLGLILYEMLTGSRAHPGENSLEILHHVASGVIRPARDLEPRLSPDLDGVLTRMLAPQPAERYPSLHECGGQLLRFADDRTRMALTNAFSPSRKAARSGSTGAADRSESPPDSGERSPAAAGSGAGGTMALPVHVSVSRPDTTLRQSAVETATEAPASRRTPSSRIGALVAAGIGVLLIMGAGISTLRRRAVPDVGAQAADQEAPAAVRLAGAPLATAPTNSAEAPPPTIPFEIRAVPPEAEMRLDDRAPVRGRLEIVLPLAGASHEIRVSAAGYLTKTVSFGPDDRPPSEIALDRAPPEVTAGASQKGAARAKGTVLSIGPSKAARPVKPDKAVETAKPLDVIAPPKRGANNALILK